MAGIFRKLAKLPTVMSSLARLSNIKLKITGWLNYNYTSFELLNEQTAVCLAKKTRMRTGAMNHMGYQKSLFLGGGRLEGRIEDQICYKHKHCLLPSYGKKSLQFQLGIAVILQACKPTAQCRPWGSDLQGTSQVTPAAYHTGQWRCWKTFSLPG